MIPSTRNRVILTTSRGLDELLQDEVSSICPDADTKLKPGQIICNVNLKEAYKLCLWSRLANRVIWVLGEGDADTEQQLYDTANQIDWASQFTHAQSFVVNFNGTNRNIKNSQFGAQRVKDAIVDSFVERGLIRPNVDKVNPDVIVQARLWRGQVIIGIDLSGKSLHQRGYRTEAGEAPLKEHVAAAVLIRSGWSKNMKKPLVDPMCGAGTVVIEAAMMATNRAPGLLRESWGFSKWKLHDNQIWRDCVKEAENSIMPCDTRLFASDIQGALVAIAKRNANKAGVFNNIQFSVKDAEKLVIPKGTTGYLVSNPPYGERLSDLATLVPFFASFGAHLKKNFEGWVVSLLTSQRDLLRQMKLRAKNNYALMNGKLECQLVNFELRDANLETKATSVGQEFGNRLRKNLKQLKKFPAQNNTNAYRIYDADLPEYNVAIDIYADWLIVQEYAPPKDIPAEKAQRRLNDIIIQLPAITGISPNNIALKVRSQQKGKSQYQKVEAKKTFITVEENGAKFYVNPTDYLDVGLFLDHRITRQIISEKSKDKNVLNLFSYTGSISVFCALRGAKSITTVDLSKTYLDWAKRNFDLNGLRGNYQFVQADCIDWLNKSTASYDLMFIDPPSFSNSKRMENTWDVQRDHVALLNDAYNHLNTHGEIIFSNNLRQFTLDDKALKNIGFSIEDITAKTIPEDFKRNPKIHQCWILRK